MGYGIEGTADCVAGQCSGAGGIHPVDQVVENPVVIQHILLILGGDGDLVRDAPDADGRVVVVLDDEFLHLGDGVLPAIRHMLGDVRDFCPNHHAVPVTQVVKILIMLIVSQVDGIGADFADHGHVDVMMLLGNGIADAFPVLMAAYIISQWADKKKAVTVSVTAWGLVSNQATDFAEETVWETLVPPFLHFFPES